MSAFIGHAKSLGELYVFYKRLNEPGSAHPKLGKYVSSDANRILNQTRNYGESSKYLRNLASAELKKEKALLKDIFNVDINMDKYVSKKDYKEIIDALNTFLNLKKVYERNKSLIKNTKGKKSVISWYPTYFMKAWEEEWPEIQQNFWDNFKRIEDAGKALELILEKKLPEICIKGIKKMLDGPEVESNLIDPNLKDAYSELVKVIGTIEKEGSLANQIYNIYDLDEIKKSLIDSIKDKDTKQIKNQFSKSSATANKLVKNNIHSRGGFTLEAIETAIFSSIKTDKNFNVFHSGDKKIKADNILTINIDPTNIYETLEKVGANREKNIAALSDLENKMKDIDNSYIIYSSDKNWTLNNKFTGFDVGSLGKNPQSFIEQIYKGDPYAGKTLLGAINNLGEGAMLANEEEAFELLLAQEVAYMLFDDYSTLGKVNSSGKAIHIMNLNGIMMPLSAILSLLADAIDTFNNKNIKSVVNVSIKAPQIYFKTDEEEIKWLSENSATPYEAWNLQKKYSLEKTKINARILKNFKQIVSLLL